MILKEVAAERWGWQEQRRVPDEFCAIEKERKLYWLLHAPYSVCLDRGVGDGTFTDLGILHDAFHSALSPGNVLHAPCKPETWAGY